MGVERQCHQSVALCFLTTDAMWPAAVAMISVKMKCTSILWAKNIISSLIVLVKYSVPAMRRGVTVYPCSYNNLSSMLLLKEIQWIYWITKICSGVIFFLWSVNALSGINRFSLFLLECHQQDDTKYELHLLMFLKLVWN